MEDKKSRKELSQEEVETIQLRVENALLALEKTLDSIDQENKHSDKGEYTKANKESGSSIVSSELIAERLDAIIMKMKNMLER
tara:strand:+ start:63 stop:311 length:249 start_codon:yes stop_codon:yes gene_type:complete